MPVFNVGALVGGVRTALPLMEIVDGPRADSDDQTGQTPIRVGRLLEMDEPPIGNFGIEVSNALWAKLIADARDTAGGGSIGSPLTWPTADAERLEEFGVEEELLGPLGPFAEREGFSTELDNELAEGIFRFRVADEAAGGILSWEIGETVFGALASTRDAFIAVVPPDAIGIEVRHRDRWDGETASIINTLDFVAGGRHGGLSERSLLVWRVYTGENTIVGDGIEVGWPRRHVRRLLLPVIRHGALLVGRIIFTANRVLDKPRHDPTFGRRLRGAELDMSAIATACPDIREAPEQSNTPTVIVVHGTMSCGVLLAARLRAQLGEVPVWRYEHDTWLPLADNAEELAAGILARGSQGRWLFVAHSRGGLVARHAADIVARDDVGINVAVIALGTPFDGTPVLDGIAAGERGRVLGTRAFLDVLATGDGLPAIDVFTRTFALLSLLGELPPGMAVMRPRSDYLRYMKVQNPSFPLVRFGGDYRDDGSDSYGLAALSGFAEAAFGGQPNDLIVGANSAAGGDGRVLPVSHFAYADRDEVMKAVVDECTRL